MNDHYYVLCNLETGSVLDVSENPLTADGHPVTVRIFEGSIPDPLTHSWNRAGLCYERKQIQTLSHIQFRKLFTAVEEWTMDTFNDTYLENPAIGNEQKAMIRTGLRKYAEASAIDLSDSGVAMLLDLYVMVGILTVERKQEIISGVFKQ